MRWWNNSPEEYLAERKFEEEHCQVCWIDKGKCVDPHKQNLNNCDSCPVSFYGREE